ncbi:MAG: PadR family transcriptional regulator [Clostridia bacterium]|nr:PadR family transcriptional regulator [Clostridia bacterium]MBQ9994473.1 PadR family transcriptional regulator [Clostridia bacterium]
MTIQFKKGVLELCILSMLKNDDQYGYNIASKMSECIDVADGSIYLVLRRLKQEDYVSSYLEESSGGPPRKYYVITQKGEQFLDELIDDWTKFVDGVNSIISCSPTQMWQSAIISETSEINGGM